MMTGLLELQGCLVHSEIGGEKNRFVLAIEGRILQQLSCVDNENITQLQIVALRGEVL